MGSLYHRQLKVVCPEQDKKGCENWSVLLLLFIQTHPFFVEIMGGDIIGEINFFGHTLDGSSPWMDSNPKLGWTASNYAHTPVRVNIHDLRGKESDFNLDNNGFEIVKYIGHVHDAFDNDSEMQRCYFDDIINLLKKRLGASRVVIFNHITRFRGPPLITDECDANHKNPVFYPHVDNTPTAARAKIEEIFGKEEAKNVMKNRFQIINIWRPLGVNPIINTPLTICDYRTIDLNTDLHVADVRNTAATIEVYAISHNIQDAQKWYYLSQMRSDEMFVFKIFDSNSDVAQFGAHTAFPNESIPKTDVEQISIELRCIVIYDQ